MSEIQFADFQSEKPPRRIIGSEAEYGVQLRARLTAEEEKLSWTEKDNIRKAQAKQALEALIRTESLASIGITTFRHKTACTWTSNGARIYRDVGDHMEYAGPECPGPRRAFHADMAGKDIMTELAYMASDEVVALYRRVGYAERADEGLTEHIDAKSSGFHENYLVTPGFNSEKNFGFIDSYLASRVSWSGMGMVGYGGYYRSQKARGIGARTGVYRSAPTRTIAGKKPFGQFMRARDINNGDSYWPRYEVRCAESNSSPWARYLGFAATTLMLRLIEQGDPAVSDDLTFKDPVRVLHHAGGNGDLRQTFEMVSGKEMSVLNHQEALANAALALCERIHLPRDELYGAQLWLPAIDDLGKVKDESDYPLVADRIEYAARHIVLSSKYPDSEISAEDSRMQALDLQWDRLGDSGIADIWWRRHPVDERIYDKSLAKELVTCAPQGTRAAPRGAAIAEHDYEIKGVGWGYVEYHDEPGSPSNLDLKYPFELAA